MTRGGWRLFLDDEREPVGDGWFIARDHDAACTEIRRSGLPSFISFDHDLGQGPDGAMFVDWLIGYMLDESLSFPLDFSYGVHSQNPIGAANIRGKMDNAIRHIGRS